MSLGLLPTPTVTICKVAKMVFNVAPGNFYLSQYLEYQTANGTSATVEALAGLAGGTDAAFVTTVLTNLGLAGDAGAEAFLTSAIAANGRGAALEAAINALAGVSASDATYGSAVAVFNTAVTKSVTYSTNAANNSTDPTALAAAVTVELAADGSVAPIVVVGQTFSLSTSTDNYSPTAAKAENVTSSGNDTFRGQLDSTDSVNGGEGSDTVEASIADGAATVTSKPLLTSIETVNFTVTDGAAADNKVTLDLGDSTGVNTVKMTMGTDTTVELKGVTDEATTVKGGGSGDGSVATVAYSGLSTVTDGGSDAKTITLDGIDVTSLTVAGVEALTLNAAGKAGDIDNLIASGLESLNITGGVADDASTTEVFAIGTDGTSDNDAIDFTGLDSKEVASINASTSTGDITLIIDDSVDVTATGGAGKFNLTNTSAGSSGASGTAAVTVTAGTGGTIAVTLEGGANASSDSAMTLVTVTGGDGKDSVNVVGAVNPTDITATSAVNESQTHNVVIDTGAGDDTITIDAGVVSLSAGAGADKLTVTTFSAVTKYDTIDMGDDSDTVIVSEATLGASQKATMAFFANSEVVETTATAEKTIDLAALGTVTSAVASGTHSATNQTGTSAEVGGDALDFTSNNTTGTLTVGALTGQVGGTSGTTGGAGGVGLDANAKLDNGSNAVTITLVDNADITGGAGGAGTTNGAGGAGGIGVDANEYETVNLVLAAKDTTKDTITFAGGAGGAGAGNGAAGAAGGAITVGANGTINITETLAEKSGSTTLTVKDHISSIDLGAITGSNVSVNAETLNGSVTIASVTGNTVINTGAGADSIGTGTGVDTINTGAGDDTIDSQTGADLITTGTGNDVLSLADQDSTESSMKKVADFGLMANSYTAASTTDQPTEIQSTDVAGANADILDITNIAVLANATAADTGVDIGGSTDIKDTLTNGMMTLSGADASAVDTLAEWIDQAEAAVGNQEAIAFLFGGNTYVVATDSSGNSDVVIELTGVQASGLAQVDSGNTSSIGGAGYVLLT